MHEEKRCTRCVLTSSFPRIKFDDQGVCNHCRNELLDTTTDSVIVREQKSVKALFDEAKGKAEYDAILCYSGGKDSTYTLKMAVEEYGLRVLAFTFDNCFISPAAFENIRRITDYLKVDLSVFRIPFPLMRNIIEVSARHELYNQKTMTRISSICNSCISIINMYALKVALEKKVPFIIAGFTLGQIPVNGIYYKNNYAFLDESRAPLQEKWTQLAGAEAAQYFRLPESLVTPETSYPYNVNLLCLEDISEEQIIEKIKKMGWVAPKDVDGCSSNCRLNTFNNYIHEKKHGFSPYELELSHLVRKKQLTRQEAIDKLNDQRIELVKKLFEELDINEQELLL